MEAAVCGTAAQRTERSIDAVCRRGRAIGIGLEGGMKTALNLLPASFQRQLLLRRRVLQWGIVLGICLVAASAVRWNDVREHQALAQRLDLLEREHQPTRRMLQELVNMRRELDQLQQLEKTAQELEYQRPALALLGVLSQVGEATGGRLRITKLELAGFQGNDAAGGRDAGGKLHSGVLLAGVSLDNQSIAKLESGLLDSEFFSQVELVKSSELTGAGEDGSTMREYELRCEL
jgi:hypothetical protein